MCENIMGIIGILVEFVLFCGIFVRRVEFAFVGM